MTVSIGTRLGPYEVLGPLGAGGMGEVYKAKDSRLGRHVAIKVLPAAFSADPERLARFEHEARAAAALNHPNILAVHDVGQHDGSPYIVSELLEGETLRERLAAGALHVRKAVEYAVQITRGLAAAHEKAIVHRDLKPENIFVTADGRVKILDFGLAKLTQAEPALSGMTALPTTPPQTQAGLMLGTIGYMAPEQVRGLPADHRSDVFALGAVLYEMLSGQRAFRGDTAADSMTAILKEDPPDLPVAKRRIPPALDRIVTRCLEKNPANRFQTAADLTFALDGLSSQSDAFQASGARIGRRPVRREIVAWSLVAIVSALAGVLGWVALVNRTPTVERSVYATVLPPANWSARGVNPASRMAIAPDGTRLAFAATGPGRRLMLWVRRLDAPSSQPLEGTDGALAPFWSPDSQVIGFFAAGKLKKINASGGPPVIVCDAPEGPTEVIGLGSASLGGAWNRDGVILFASSGSGLQRVSASGGTPASVTTLQGREVAHQLPFFLPDGQHFLYRAVTGTTGTVREGTEIRIGSLDSTEIRPLLRGVSQAMYAQGHVLFGRDDTLMAQAFDVRRLETAAEPVPLAGQLLSPSGYSAFSVSQNGVLVYQDANAGGPSRLVWVDRDGKELATIGDEGEYADIRLSSDGKRAAVSLRVAQNNSRDIWIFDLARGFPTRFTSDAADDLTAIWSPDDDRVVFNSRRGGRLGLFQKASAMVGEETVLLADGDDNFPMSWSSDGRFILYASTGSGKQGLWVLPLFGDRKPFPFAQSASAEVSGQFSPDGRWIAYSSNQSGRFEIWAAPFPGPGPRTQISTEGVAGQGGFARWRRDGKELYYADGDFRLMAVQVSAEGSEFRVGTPRPLFEMRAKVADRAPYDVSADGQRFLINRATSEQEARPITLVVNWLALLKK